MSTLQNWSILAAGLMAAACATAGKPASHHGETQNTPPAATEEPSAFPEQQSLNEAPPPEAPTPTAGIEGGSAGADLAPAARPAPAPTGAAPRGESAARDDASSDRRSASSSPAKKAGRPLELEQERPGLGTTWGETMSSRVSNSPFDRASSNPFSLTTIRYNDQSGIAAMLRGASPVAFRTSAAAVVENGVLTVRLVDAGGSPLPTFATGGKNLAQGEVGQRYMIEIVNQSSNRFEAVVTVDGLDVIDGRAGSTGKRGYLVQPFATVDIDGFRQNLDEVAAFRFGSVRGSYAAGKGSDRNVGVIGVAFFSERGATLPWSEREIGRRDAADPFPGRFAAPPIAR